MNPPLQITQEELARLEKKRIAREMAEAVGIIVHENDVPASGRAGGHHHHHHHHFGPQGGALNPHGGHGQLPKPYSGLHGGGYAGGFGGGGGSGSSGGFAMGGGGGGGGGSGHAVGGRAGGGGGAGGAGAGGARGRTDASVSSPVQRKALGAQQGARARSPTGQRGRSPALAKRR